MALVPPEALKALKPYVTLSSQLDARNDKIISYYCNFFKNIFRNS